MKLQHKLKVAYFLDIPKGLGGAGNLLLQQARIMSEIHQVVVVIPCDGQGNINEEYLNRCQKYNLKTKGIQYSTAYEIKSINLLDALRSYEIIRKFVVDEQINFLHTVQLNIAVEKVARDLNIPHLMNIYQLQTEEFRIDFGDIYPQYHLCDSELYSKLWSSQIGIESRCIRPIAPLDSIQKKDDYKLSSFVIVMLGSVCERKNQLTAIKAIERCLRLGYKIKLMIAGDDSGTYAEKCKEYVESNNLHTNISFVGFISDVGELLSNADCFLCTSIDESFPSSIVEAVTYDLTIISTPVAGVPEIFWNNDNSYISSDFSVERIVKSLQDCFEAYHSGDISRVHDNVADTWKQEFSQKAVQIKIDQYYQYISSNYIKKQDRLMTMKKAIEETYDMLRDIEGIEFVKSRCLYYTFLKQNLKVHKAYLWGAGKYGKIAVELIDKMKLPIEIIAFVDNNKTGKYCGIPIIKPEEIIYSENNIVFLSFAGYKKDVLEILSQKQYKLNDNLWELP